MKQTTDRFHLILSAVAAVATLLAVSMAGTVLAAGEEETEPELEYSRGVKQCMACHKEGREKPAHEIFLTTMGIKGDPASPFAEGNHDCEACHGPSAHHIRKQKDGSRLPPTVTFSDKEPVEKQNEMCMSCHNDGGRFHWPGSAHDVEGNACVDCHDVHAPNDAVMALETQPEVCYDCDDSQDCDGDGLVCCHTVQAGAIAGCVPEGQCGEDLLCGSDLECAERTDGLRPFCCLVDLLGTSFYMCRTSC